MYEILFSKTLFPFFSSEIYEFNFLQIDDDANVIIKTILKNKNHSEFDYLCNRNLKKY